MLQPKKKLFNLCLLFCENINFISNYEMALFTTWVFSFPPFLFHFTQVKAEETFEGIVREGKSYHFHFCSSTSSVFLLTHVGGRAHNFSFSFGVLSDNYMILLISIWLLVDWMMFVDRK